LPPPALLSKSAYKRRFFTKAEIARHNTVESCWLIVKNVVYDVTYFLPLHPAGCESILRHGGEDATLDFEFHSSGARRQWTNYRIGRVATTKKERRAAEDAAAAVATREAARVAVTSMATAAGEPFAGAFAALAISTRSEMSDEKQRRITTAAPIPAAAVAVTSSSRRRADKRGASASMSAPPPSSAVASSTASLLDAACAIM
jgi:cytochrome b involved in lipid metabolism